jgi:hypothetical protein
MNGSTAARSGVAEMAGRSRRRGRALSLLFRPLVFSAMPVGTLVWIGVALASAGSPVKGGIYEGTIGGPNSPGGPAQETLTVSRDGRKVASVIVLPPECGQPGGSAATVRNVKIVNGSFKATYPRTATRQGVFNDATLTGHFLAHGRVSGREDVRSNETINGSLCKYSLAWSAAAQPVGTKQCPNHVHGRDEFFNILIIGTTCAVVDKAADKGTFSQAGGSTSVPRFSTPGWTCRVLRSGVDNHRCTKAHPKATFSFSTVA